MCVFCSVHNSLFPLSTLISLFLQLVDLVDLSLDSGEEKTWNFSLFNSLSIDITAIMKCGCRLLTNIFTHKPVLKGWYIIMFHHKSQVMKYAALNSQLIS